MAKRARQSFAQRLEEEAASGVFGPNGSAAAATLTRVIDLDDADVERLANAQTAVDALGIRFFEAWHGVHERARGSDLLVFQHTVSWAHSAADRRLESMDPG